MKFLHNVNPSPSWEQVFVAAGWEAVHRSCLGRSDAYDEEIMVYAALHSWIVVTHDLEFGAALALKRFDKPSVVQVRSGDVEPVLLGTELVAVLRSTTQELEDGALFVFTALKSRIRLLPLGTTEG